MFNNVCLLPTMRYVVPAREALQAPYTLTHLDLLQAAACPGFCPVPHDHFCAPVSCAASTCQSD